MIHTSPSFVSDLAIEPPDTVPLHEWLWAADDAAHERHGRCALAKARNPFVCGLTGKTHAASSIPGRIEALARALAKELGFEVNEGTEFDKVVGVFSINSIDTFTTYWAIHRLNGIPGLITSSYTVVELTHQLKAMGSKALVTCASLLETALEAAAAVGIPRERIYILDVAEVGLDGTAAMAKTPEGFKTIDELIVEGECLPLLDKVAWAEGQGARQTAYFSTSSGTSGVPKIIMIPHHSIIANTLQWIAFQRNVEPQTPETVLSVLPYSHSYSLILIGHMGIYRGDSAIVFPSFSVEHVCRAIQHHRIETLWTVPPMLVAMLRAPHITKNYSLDSVRRTFAGATNLTLDTIEELRRLIPGTRFCQGYGQTESAVIVSFQNGEDWMLGSVGHLMPGVQARLVDEKGKDVEGRLGVRGELLLKAPGRMLGYWGDEEATREAVTEDGWLRTGDLMEFRESEQGHENLFMIDRVKQVIKVMGLQVAPAELEGILSSHPFVADMCVVGILSETAGELPLAYIVLSEAGKAEQAVNGAASLRQRLDEFMAQQLADFKRLAGGIIFVEALPKTATGKTRRGEVKDWAKALYEEQTRKRKLQEEKEEEEEEEEEEREAASRGDAAAAHNGKKVPAAVVVLQTMEFGSDEDEDDE